MSRDFTMPRRAFIIGGSAVVVGAAVISLRRCGRTSVPEAVDPVVDPAPLAPGQHALPTEEPIVRVRIVRGAATDAPLHFGRSGQWLASEPILDGVETTALDHTRFMPLEGPVTVSRRNGQWRVHDCSGYEPDLPTRGWVLRALDPAKDASIPFEDVEHAGSYSFHATNDDVVDQYDVVNHLGIESYLPGVLAGELYTHWHEATFRAQAIAARSFACAEHAFFRARRHFDLTNTTRSQMYVPSAVHPRARDAVEATAGDVLEWGGGLVPGYYSSCCGGASADARYAIGPSPTNDLPPLRGRAEPDVCTDAPRYRWSMQRPVRDCTARLAAFGSARRLTELATLETVRAIEPVLRMASGRPITYRVRGTDDQSVELAAALLRRGLDYSTRGLPRPAERLHASYLEFESIGDRTMQINGRGFGHGVGLCQYGAQTLATRGSDHASILAWYYPEASIRRAFA